jgi:hypothetical protein
MEFGLKAKNHMCMIFAALQLLPCDEIWQDG